MGGWTYNCTTTSIPHKSTYSCTDSVYAYCRSLLLGDKPSLKELRCLTNVCNKVMIIKSVAPKWKELAMEMGYEYGDIESVDMKAHKDPQSAAYEILGRWLAGSEGLCAPVTWSTLIECLSNIECQSLADRLKDVLN